MLTNYLFRQILGQKVPFIALDKIADLRHKLTCYWKLVETVLVMLLRTSYTCTERIMADDGERR